MQKFGKDINEFLETIKQKGKNNNSSPISYADNYLQESQPREVWSKATPASQTSFHDRKQPNRRELGSTNSNVDTNYSRGRNIAINYIGLATKSTGAVRQKLKDQGYNEDLIEQIIMDLEDDSYLDDYKMAIHYINNRRQRDYEALAMLKKRLLDRGIKATAIIAALKDSELNDRDLAIAYFSSRFTQTIIKIINADTDLQNIINSRNFNDYGMNLNNAVFYHCEIQRIIRNGLRRGFTISDCKFAITQIISDI